ncbi:MAG: hypothetical protein V1839_03605 [archaeon]
MTNKIVIVALAAILLVIPTAFACPPSELFGHFAIKDVKVYSENFHFVSYESSMHNVNEKYTIDNGYPAPYFPPEMYFGFEGNPQNLRVVVNGNEIVNAKIETLKTEIERNDFSTPEIVLRKYTAYEFPKLNLTPYNSAPDPKYEGADAKIYLDSELVREYTITIIPPKISDCGGMFISPPAYLTLAGMVALPILIIGAAVYFVLKARNNKAKKKR